MSTRTSEEGFYSEKCFDRIGKPIIREIYVEFFMIILPETSKDEDGTKFKSVIGS